VSEAGDDIVIDTAIAGGGDGADVFDVEGVTLVDDVTDDGGNDSVVVGGQVSFTSSKAFTVGSDDAGNTVVASGALSSSLSNVASVSVATQTDASDTISVIDGALEFVNGLRADLGAVQSRFESTIANLSTTAENLSAARSRIQDADFAQETAALTRAQILQQAGTSVLAQANQTPQNVLALLQ
jgi:flagellin